MPGSIGKIAEEVLDQVKHNKLVKLAQHQAFKEIEKAPKTELGSLLKKMAMLMRNNLQDDITVEELSRFVHGER